MPWPFAPPRERPEKKQVIRVLEARFALLAHPQPIACWHAAGINDCSEGTCVLAHAAHRHLRAT